MESMSVSEQKDEENELLKKFQNGTDLIYYDRQLKIYIPETLRAGSRIFDAMLSAVSTQNSKIYVAFYRRPLFDSLEQFAQRSALSEVAVWFEKDVVQFMVEEEWGIAFALLPPFQASQWDIVCLPFREGFVRNALIAADNIIRCTRGALYSKRSVRMLEYITLRMLRLHGLTHEDYHFRSPSEWINGVHSAQLVLLFLKQCVHCSFIEIQDPEKKEQFMQFNSMTCMPMDLEELLCTTWGVFSTNESIE